MRRRVFLATLAPAVAGCLSTARSTTSDEAEVLSLDEPYRTDDDVEVVIEDFVVADHLETTGASIPAAFDHLFLVVSMQVTNVGDHPRSLPSADAFRLLGDTEQFEPRAESGQFTEPVVGEPYSGMADARAGVEVAGYLVFNIPRQRTTMDLSFHDRVADEDIRWHFDPSDAIGAFPMLTLESLHAPERSAVGDPIAIELTVSNDGDAAGSIDGTVWTVGALRDERPWSLEVPEQTRATETLTFTPEEEGELHLTVDPFDVTERMLVE